MINKNTNNKKQTLPQPQSPTPGAPAPAPHKARTIKLGVDVHLDVYVVVRIIDGTTPQPPQRFKPGDFLPWCVKQLTLAEKVERGQKGVSSWYCHILFTAITGKGSEWRLDKKTGL